MLQFKQGVDSCGLCEEIHQALKAATAIFAEHGADCVVTSARNGIHSAEFSRHYAGLAVDLRRHHLTLREFEAIRIKLKDTLGRHYTVIPESTHYHIQYKPRYQREDD